MVRPGPALHLRHDLGDGRAAILRQAVDAAPDEEAGPEWTAMMKSFGQRWWAKLEPKVYDLLCNKENEDHDKFMEALGDGAKTLAVALAGALVAPGVVPAVAIVLATIAAKKIFDSGLEAACEMWKESLDARAEEVET